MSNKIDNFEPRACTMPYFHQTLEALRATRSTAHLIKTRDIDALAMQHWSKYDSEENANSTLLSVKKIELVAFATVAATLETGGAMLELANKIGLTKKESRRTQYNKSQSAARRFGPIIINPETVDSSDYVLGVGHSRLNNKQIELHLESTAKPFTARDALRGLGAAAVYLGQNNKLVDEYDNVTAVSYPELIQATLKLGMKHASVNIRDKGYKQAIDSYRAAYYLLNGSIQSQFKPMLPAASYLPTGEFVECFSRYAPASN